MDAAKVFSYGRDIGLIVDAGGTILASTQGGEDALAYGTLGLVGAGLNSLLDEAPRVPLFGNEEEGVARLYRDIHIKTGSGRILTIHAITFPLGDSIEPKGARLIIEQELHRAVADARGIGKPLGLLFDSIGAAVWSFDVDGTILTWNRTSEAYFAHSRAGQFSPASVFMGVEDLNRIREAANSTGSYHGNVALSARDAKARVNKIWVMRLVSEDNDPVGYACISMDPEEHTRAEDLQKVLAEQPGDAVLLIDRETAQILDVNLKACELLCCGREDLVRKKVMDFMSENRPTLGAEILGALKADGVIQMGRQLLRRKDGFLLPVMVTITPATLGQERYGLAFLVDLSSRVRIEDTVRKEREVQDRQLVEERENLKKSMDLQGGEVADLRHQLAEARKREEALTRMVGEARKREEGLAPKADATREHDEEIQKKAAAAQGRADELRKQVEAAGGREKDLQQKAEAAQRRADELRKQVEAAGGREKDLQQKVEAAQRRADELRKQVEGAAQREEELQKQVEAAQALEADLRRELQELKSRPPAPPPAPPRPGVDVNRVLEEALAVFEEKSGRKVKVAKVLRHVPPVDCLPELLKEVILTALNGIAEGAGKKGRINIRTRQNRKGAVIEIVDKGGGIGPSILAHLFDPAMAEAKSRVTAALLPGSGGRISFRVNPGKSALCRIELPAPR